MLKVYKNYFYPSFMKNQDEDGRTDTVTYRVASTRLKMFVRKFSEYREFIKHMPNSKFKKLSEVLLTIDTEALIDL